MNLFCHSRAQLGRGKILRTQPVLWLVGFAFVLASSTLWAQDLTDLFSGDGSPDPVVTEQLISTDSNADTDRRVQQRLQNIFAEIDALADIKVEVVSGVVTLQGEVDSVAAEAKALRLASQVQGAVEVENQLSISRAVQQRTLDTWWQVAALGERVIYSLPLFILGLGIFLLFWLLGRWLGSCQSLYLRLSRNGFIAELLGQIVHVALIVIGAILALVLLDAQALIGTLLGAAGLIGLAIGFAVRDTVENYIASILLSVRNPFEINDFVNVDGYEGNVAKLTSRATILISPDGNHVRITNARVFKAVIINFSRHPERRFEFDVGIDCTSDILAAQALALQTLAQMEGVLADPKPSVVVQQLGDSNVLLRVYAWVNQQRYSFVKVRSEAIRQIKQAYDSAAIAMPEPIYNIILHQPADTTQPMQEEKISAVSAAHLNAGQLADARDVAVDLTIEEKVNELEDSAEADNLLRRDSPQEI